ncbi:MAG: family 20 glycosylhydrolase [Ignavibacteriaceae bacterium]
MKIFLSILLCLIMLTVKAQNTNSQNHVSLIPLPEKVEWTQGHFILSGKSSIVSKSAKLTEYFAEQLKNYTGIELSESSPDNSEGKIHFLLEPSFLPSNKEAYSLSVTEDKIEIKSSGEEGLFRGIQTLFQLIPASAKTSKSNTETAIPACNISDKPVFLWRGLNLDCCRHFMTKDFIKRYIDILAYYKFNILHWHITEDQGWRIEIKKYPKLTEVGAWRKEADGSIYGGYYSQEDIKEIVAYAQSRFITVVPEIEMPGHSLASLASYPENSCTGGPFEVTNMWGVMKDIYCAGRDSTFYFLQNILDEVISLFPGEYIHIGGDEAPKDRWKECPRCQARIKSEGLKDEHELQSYFITRISEYLNSKGKKIIGWDEILEGGLAPGAVVQSWQDFNGAIEAAKLGHYTICSPASHTYLNSDPDDLDLRIAYSFNPIPDELTEEQKKYVLGSEANLWTEQAPQETVDSKLFPRILALTEVFWSNPDKNYDEFYTRVQNNYEDLTALGIQYGRESKVFTPVTSYDETKNEFIISMVRGQEGLDIRYTNDGSDPGSGSLLYTEPIRVNKSVTLRIAAFRNNHFIGKKSAISFDFHKAVGTNISIVHPYDERYRASGPNALIDGVRGTDNFRDGSWQGYLGDDFECIIDLGEEKEISKVIPRFILTSNSWIFLPNKVEVTVSNDNTNFNDAKTIINDVPQKNSEIVLKDFPAEFSSLKARYIKIKAENIKTIPDWHPGAGNKAWMFIDEIVVE